MFLDLDLLRAPVPAIGGAGVSPLWLRHSRLNLFAIRNSFTSFTHSVRKSALLDYSGCRRSNVRPTPYGLKPYRKSALLDLLRAQEVSLSNLRFLSAQFLRYPEFVRCRSLIPSANPLLYFIMLKTCEMIDIRIYRNH